MTVNEGAFLFSLCSWRFSKRFFTFFLSLLFILRRSWEADLWYRFYKKKTPANVLTKMTHEMESHSQSFGRPHVGYKMCTFGQVVAVFAHPRDSVKPECPIMLQRPGKNANNPVQEQNHNKNKTFPRVAGEAWTRLPSNAPWTPVWTPKTHLVVQSEHRAKGACPIWDRRQ